MKLYCWIHVIWKPKGCVIWPFLGSGILYLTNLFCRPLKPEACWSSRSWDKYEQLMPIVTCGLEYDCKPGAFIIELSLYPWSLFVQVTLNLKNTCWLFFWWGLCYRDTRSFGMREYGAAYIAFGCSYFCSLEFVITFSFPLIRLCVPAMLVDCITLFRPRQD